MQQTSVDRRTFLSRVSQSGLLSSQQIKAGLADLPETNRGKAVARAFVDQGLLTKFQAELLLAGRTTGFFLGQYRILEQIGEGGMGRVYKATHQAMNRTVAIKILAPQHTRTERARQLFEREVQASAKLLHPNIVTAYDANESDGRLYLAMEYVDGPNLDQLVRERGPLPAGLACDIVRQASLGLQCAHEVGMVHRDVKPHNLLLHQPQGAGGPCIVKILDFGLARLSEPAGNAKNTIVTRGNVVMGTPDFLSPEQSRNLHKIDIRADLYSLGCTFYYLLTGRVPFPGGNALDKLIRHSSEDARPVDELRPDVPAAVAALVRRLMAKNPADRYQTPAELASALAQLTPTAPGSWSAEATAPTLAAIEDTNAHYDTRGFHFLDDSGPEMSAGVGDGNLSPDLMPTPLALDLMPTRQGGRNWLVWGLELLCVILGGMVVALLMRP